MPFLPSFPTFWVNSDIMVSISILAEIRWLCYVRCWNWIVPGTHISTYFNSGFFGLGCYDKAELETSDAVLNPISWLHSWAAAFAENVTPTTRFGSQTVTLTLCGTARNSNKLSFSHFSQKPSQTICSMARAGVPQTKPGSARQNPRAWLCRAQAYTASITLAKSHLSPHSPSPTTPLFGSNQPSSCPSGEHISSIERVKLF